MNIKILFTKQAVKIESTRAILFGLRESSLINWSVEVRIPEKEFYKSSEVILYVTLIGIIASLFFIFILAFPISAKKFTSNIRNLDKAIGRVRSGDFDTRIKITSKDEVGNLEANFNEMVSTTQGSIKEIYEKEQLKKEAERLAVHYQINPHLLFNTFNSVQWKARFLKGQMMFPI